MKVVVILVILVALSVDCRRSSERKRYDRYRDSDNGYRRYDSKPMQWPIRRDWSWDRDRYSRKNRLSRDRLRRKYTRLEFHRGMFFYWDTVYDNWTNWTECDPLTCVTSRFRKCLDNSWEERVRDFKVEAKCPVQYIYERRKCSDIKECQIDNNSTGDVSIKSLPSMCGVRPEYIKTKIYGGSESVQNTWPWHGGLYVINKERKPIYICGATLINPGWAITAAHCLRTFGEVSEVPLGELVETTKYDLFDKFQLVFGDHDRDKKDTTEKVTKISHFVIHPEFRADYTSNLNDIALLKLEKVIPRQKNIDFACLPESENYTLETSAICHAIGWGQMYSQDPFNIWSTEFNWLFDKYNIPRPTKSKRNINVLHEVDIPLVEFEKCRKVYRIFNLNKDIHICAGSMNKDTCRGDSGGGLFCQDPKSNRWQLYGITNFGSARGCGKSYGVYVRVAAMTDWIKNILSQKV